MSSLYRRVTDAIAGHLVLALASFEAALVFFALGFVPVFYPALLERVLFISNQIQLVSMALIPVGMALMNRAQMRRSEEDSKILRQELSTLKELVRENKRIERILTQHYVENHK